MYDYIQRQENYKLYICENNKLYIKDMPIQKVFNNLLSKELTDLKSREQVTKKYLGFKSRVPIFVNPENLFICIKSYRSCECLYLNFFAIKSYVYYKEVVLVNFHTNHQMIIREKRTFAAQIKKCDTLLTYIK